MLWALIQQYVTKSTSWENNVRFEWKSTDFSKKYLPSSYLPVLKHVRVIQAAPWEKLKQRYNGIAHVE